MYSDYKRPKKRMREIPFNNLERVKEGLEYKWNKIEGLMKKSSTQRQRYKACNAMPANVYYALEKAMLLRVREKADEQCKMIMNLFAGKDQD